MTNVSATGAEPRFLYRNAGDLQTAVGRAINAMFLAPEEAVVRDLAAAARCADRSSPQSP